MSPAPTASVRLLSTPTVPTAWETLAYIYTELPRVRAELALLSEGTFGDRVAWLNADKETRREIADRILVAGGLPTFDGKRVEVG